MIAYAALLRGVNVGGRTVVPMADLRRLFAQLGYPDARTYIQSGNVIFESDVDDQARLASDIAQAVTEEFDRAVAVMLRTRADLDQIAAANPFAERDLDPSKLLVSFLSEAPGADVAARLVVPEGLPEEMVLKGRELYIHYPNGAGRSKLSPAFFDGRLGDIRATARNWRTVEKLRELMRG
ncbi:MAG: DUF1697 domain-containing protein [Stackebrandtia sp.]